MIGGKTAACLDKPCMAPNSNFTFSLPALRSEAKMRVPGLSSSSYKLVGLLDLANKKIGCPIKFEF